MLFSVLAHAIRHLALLASLGVTGAAAQQVTLTPVEVRVPTPPIPVSALGRTHLVYELHLTNFDAKPLEVGVVSGKL